jgi:hypothetical protein
MSNGLICHNKELAVLDNDFLFVIYIVQCQAGNCQQLEYYILSQI